MAATETNARQTADTDRRDGAKPHTTPSARLVNHGRTLHEGGRGRIGIDEFSQGWFLLHTVIVQ